MKQYRNKKFNDIPNIYKDAKLLSSIRNTCDYLDELNSILDKCIPTEYTNLCHFGAIDENKNIIILFIKDQLIFHRMRTMSENILRALEQNNFNFDGILFKVKQYHQEYKPQQINKCLSKTQKEKLTKLAEIIGKPELIHHESLAINDEDTEIVL
ncbi:MAG: hypothetical protein ACK5Z5_10385 [Neisseriaceae bacterium]